MAGVTKSNYSNIDKGTDEIAESLCNLKLGHPVRVGIDGVTGAGKSTVASLLASKLRGLGRSVIQASIDGFHNPAGLRLKRGDFDAVGYNWDSFNYRGLCDRLLIPLGPQGDLAYTVQIYDQKSERAVLDEVEVADKNAILLFDGVMLFRQELVEYWDVKVFISIDVEIAFRRAALRDKAKFGSSARLRRKFETRYKPAQLHYVDQYRPAVKADFVISNNKLIKDLVVDDEVSANLRCY